MSEPTILNAFELDRLDLFATQTLLKTVINHLLKQADDPAQLVQALSASYEASVDLFELRGVDIHKQEAGREYMMAVGLDMLSRSAPPSSD